MGVDMLLTTLLLGFLIFYHEMGAACQRAEAGSCTQGEDGPSFGQVGSLASQGPAAFLEHYGNYCVGV